MSDKENIVTKISEKDFVGLEETVHQKLSQLAGQKLSEMKEAVKLDEDEEDKDAECGADEDELENTDTDKKKDDEDEE